MKQEIALVADAMLWKNHNTTLVHEKRPKLDVHAMRVGIKEKNVKLYVRMIKLLTMANPVYGFGFLDKISCALVEIMTSFSFIVDLMLSTNNRFLVIHVERYWSSNEVLEMTLEKLEMEATCNTTPYHKTKFL